MGYFSLWRAYKRPSNSGLFDPVVETLMAALPLAGLYTTTEARITKTAASMLVPAASGAFASAEALAPAPLGSIWVFACS